MAAAKQEAESTKWTKNDVDTFVKVMLDEVIKGNKISSTFNKTGWANIKTNTELKIGRPFTFRQLKNKMNKLRAKYGSFKRLLETSGFGWCESTGNAVTEDPAIWEDHIKANPGWAKFKKQGLPQWPQLCQIFSDSYATGDGGITSTQDHNVIDDDDEAFVVEPNARLGTSSGLHSPAVESGLNEPPSNIHRLDRPPTALKKKSKHGDLDVAITKMAEVSQRKLDLFSSSTSPSLCSVARSTAAEPVEFTLTNCVAALEAIEGLSRELYVKALEKVAEDPSYRELLIIVPAEKKLWLIESWL